MSNIQENSIIALLDAPDHIKSVLDTSMWVSERLNNPIGLLYSTPSNHKKKAVDYSGCLNMDEEEHMLHDLASEEYQENLTLKNQGKELLHKAQEYCQSKGNQRSYPLHRQCSIEESINYVDDKVELIITGDDLTCKTTLSNLIRPAHSPVLVTHSPFSRPRSALFAFDNKETCHSIIEQITTGALSSLIRNIYLHIVIVAEENEYNKDALREAYAKLTQASIKCKKQLINIKKVDDVSTAILSYQTEHKLEMLISGAFGQSRLKEWLQGSETQKLLKKHKTPYLLFPKSQ